MIAINKLLKNNAGSDCCELVLSVKAYALGLKAFLGICTYVTVKYNIGKLLYTLIVIDYITVTYSKQRL